MGLNDGFILFLGPAFLFDVRVEVVMPPLSTLLADSAREVFGDVGPIFCSMF